MGVAPTRASVPHSRLTTARARTRTALPAGRPASRDPNIARSPRRPATAIPPAPALQTVRRVDNVNPLASVHVRWQCAALRFVMGSYEGQPRLKSPAEVGTIYPGLA